jgi:hypothetical protein
MNQQTATPSASDNSGKQPPVSKSFEGFELPKSNYVFCPNQFFDVCLKSKSRGMVRIVAYIIRQTLGWLDENGQPVNETVKVSYRDLIEKAGVSRGAIGKALQQAVACGFLERSVGGQANAKGQASQTAEYTLRWDTSSHYTQTFANFNGFYAGEGNRTPIPNSFFDVVVPRESLAVVKVVGAVIRYTVGFETRYGGRRMTYPMSCSFIQRYTLLSNRRNLIAALKHAVDYGYIVKVKEGTFSHRTSEQEATTYGIRWLAEQQKANNSSKMTPAVSERFKNDTSIEITKPKDISKQQVAVDLDSETKQRLLAAGFDEATSKKLLAERGVAVAENQLDWIDARKPKNRLAMLRKAIEEDWTEPASFAVKQKLAATRQREAIHNAAQLSEEGIVNQQKADRQKRLLAQWQSATQSQRAAWISLAAKRQTAKSLQQIIARQSPSTEKPHAQVLDQVAVSTDLPALTLEPSAAQPASVAKQPKSQPAPSATDSKSNTAGTPQKEKPPTEMASF